MTTTTTPAAAPLTVTQATADPTGTISVDKTNSVGGETIADRGHIQPGDSFDYQLAVTCSSINQDCVHFQVVDTFPAGVVVDASTIPASVPGLRTVTWDGQTLTIVYVEPLTNPVGETGLVAGGGDTVAVRVTLPADTVLTPAT